MKSTSQKLNELKYVLSSLRIPLIENEYQLHDYIAAALRGGGFDMQHEVILGARCRIDFLVNGIGIEVKRGKPQKAALIQQCTRYLQSDRLDALILVLDASVSLPDKILDKPIVVFGLNRLWGIALP